MEETDGGREWGERERERKESETENQKEAEGLVREGGWSDC